MSFFRSSSLLVDVASPRGENLLLVLFFFLGVVVGVTSLASNMESVGSPVVSMVSVAMSERRLA